MKASAFVVGGHDGQGAVLKELAKQIGFDRVYSYRGMASVEKQAATSPLLYFFFAGVADLRKLRPTALDIRGSQNPRIRFSTMVYFSKSPPLETIKGCINLGFDDIITLPFTHTRVVSRLSRQLDRKLVFFETPTYFGPDRRDRLEHEEGHALRGTGGQYRRLEIVRNALAGVSVLSEETHVML